MSSKSGILAKKCQSTPRNHLLTSSSSSSITQLYSFIDKTNDKNKSAQSQFLHLSTSHSNNSPMVRTESNNYSSLELSTKVYESIDDSIVFSTESSLGGAEYENNEKLSTVEPLKSSVVVGFSSKLEPHKASNKTPERCNKAPKTTNFELSNRRLLRILHEGANGNLIDIRHSSKGPNGYNMYGDGIRLSLDEWNVIMSNRRHITQQLKCSSSANKRNKKKPEL